MQKTIFICNEYSRYIEKLNGEYKLLFSLPWELALKQHSKQTSSKAFHHRGTEDTEFYFVNCAYGAVNNKKFFSVLSVPLW